MNVMKSFFALIFMSMVLASCQDDTDLEAFVAEVNKRSSGQIEPLPELKVYESYHYSSNVLRSPFEPPFSDKSRVNLGKGPEMGREKEPLEAYPLDSLRLVGALQKKGVLWALIIDKSGMVHKLTVGNYLGQNYGKINKITENKIELIEMVSDNQGRWQEKPTIMNLLQ